MNNESKKQNKWLRVGFVISLMLLLAMVTSKEIGNWFKQLLILGLKPNPTLPSVIYEAADISPKFEHLWTMTDVFANYRRFEGGIHLVAIDEYIFLLGSVGEDKIGSMSLTKIRLPSGDIENNFRPFERGIGSASTVGIKSDLIFIGFEGTQKISGETTWGASQVAAYDSVTGKMVWSTVVPGARSIASMTVTDSAVSVNGNFSSNYYLYSEKTGEILDVRAKQDNNFIWLIENNISYEESKTATFQAIDRQTGTLLWETSEYFGIYQPLILTKNTIVARSGKARFSGTVFAVDKATGELLWHYKGVLSNVATAGSTAFFLTEDVQLMAIDVNTGETIGQVNFSPDWIDDPVNSSFHVASSGDFMVAYFGDSRQMFAFRFLADE